MSSPICGPVAVDLPIDQSTKRKETSGCLAPPSGKKRKVTVVPSSAPLPTQVQQIIDTYQFRSQAVVSPSGTQYRVTQFLGKGAHGEVVAVENERTGSPRALKVSYANRDVYKAMRHEAKMNRLADGAPHGIEVGADFSTVIQGQRTHVIEMERVEIPDLKQMIAATGPLEHSAIISFATQALEWLSSLHSSRKLIHCDVNSRNLFFDPDPEWNEFKGGDLSLARCIGSVKAGQLVQTKWWRAPEIFLEQEYGFQIDIWGLGCTLFEAYTGKVLFKSVASDKKSTWEDHLALIGSRLFSSTSAQAPWKREIYAAAQNKGETREHAWIVAELIAPMLERDPKKRITAAAALMHPSLNYDVNFKIDLQVVFEQEIHLCLFDPIVYKMAVEQDSDISPLFSRELTNRQSIQDCFHVKKLRGYMLTILDGEEEVLFSSEIAITKGSTIKLDRDESGELRCSVTP